jgi:glutamate--cysteine ligase
MVRKLRVALALQPVATALFASSPFFEGGPTGTGAGGRASGGGLDDARTGMLPFAFEEGHGVRALRGLGARRAHVLRLPRRALHRRLGQSFRDFMAGRLPALPGEVPTLSDWADHLTTVFPEARVKQFIEMRGRRHGRPGPALALPAFWTGLFMTAALDAAWDLVKASMPTARGAAVAARSGAARGGGGCGPRPRAARAGIAEEGSGASLAASPTSAFLRPLWDSRARDGCRPTTSWAPTRA